MALYALGVPGGSPRIIMQAETAEELSGQLLTGEVCLPIEEMVEHTIAEDGASIAIAQQSLETAKAEKILALSALAEAKLSLWEGGNVQVDDISTGRMTSWATQALVSKATGTAFDLPFWIMADNSHHTFSSADDFLAFAQAAAAYKTAAILNKSALKAAIAVAADETALNAIDINGGWPT